MCVCVCVCVYVCVCVCVCVCMCVCVCKRERERERKREREREREREFSWGKRYNARLRLRKHFLANTGTAPHFHFTRNPLYALIQVFENERKTNKSEKTNIRREREREREKISTTLSLPISLPLALDSISQAAFLNLAPIAVALLHKLYHGELFAFLFYYACCMRCLFFSVFLYFCTRRNGGDLSRTSYAIVTILCIHRRWNISTWVDGFLNVFINVCIKEVRQFRLTSTERIIYNDVYTYHNTSNDIHSRYRC